MYQNIQQNRIKDLVNKLREDPSSIKKFTKLEKDTCIFYLRTYELLSQTEIASLMGLDRQTVRRAIGRVLEYRVKQLETDGVDIYKEYIMTRASLAYVKRKARESDNLDVMLKVIDREVEYMFRFGLIDNKPKKTYTTLEENIAEQLKDKSIKDIDGYINEIREYRKCIRESQGQEITENISQ